jgi:Icc-related predicted phosphoesterase
MRIAAVGDIHVGADSVGMLAPGLADIEAHADVLLLAGDLTKCGTVDEALLVAEELSGVTVPVIAVLGNHDHHADVAEEVTKVLESSGIRVLEGESVIVDVRGHRLGVAGVKGFGGGFAGACAADFGEREMRDFVRHAREVSTDLERALGLLDADLRVALLHYSPVPDTLVGERLEIYPFLGSYLLGEAIDRAGAHLVLHGHAHAGTDRGETAGGVPVRNVALPVIGAAYHVFALPTDGTMPFLAAAAALPRS